MSGVTGNIASLSQFAKSLSNLPTVVAQKVAARSAPVLSALVQGTFASSEDAYGVAWAPGAEGQTVDLVDTGALKRGVSYVATGTRLRMRLAAQHAKYQVGKRPVAPRQGERLPVEYASAMASTAAEVVREELGK